MFYKSSLIVLLSICAIGQIDQSYQLGVLGNVIHGKIENHGLGIDCDLSDAVCADYWIND